MKTRLARLAARTYGRHLQEGEEVRLDVEATASGVGRTVVLSAILAAVTGALVSFALNGAMLPYLVFGSFVGVVVGAFLAARSARSDRGPGAALVRVAVTTRRLLILRQRSALRFKPLRAYPLSEVDQVESSRSPIGAYHHVTINLTGGQTLDLLARHGDDLARLLREHSQGEQVD